MTLLTLNFRIEALNWDNASYSNRKKMIRNFLKEFYYTVLPGLELLVINLSWDSQEFDWHKGMHHYTLLI